MLSHNTACWDIAGARRALEIKFVELNKLSIGPGENKVEKIISKSTIVSLEIHQVYKVREESVESSSAHIREKIFDSQSNICNAIR